MGTYTYIYIYTYREREINLFVHLHNAYITDVGVTINIYTAELHLVFESNGPLSTMFRPLLESTLAHAQTR